MARERIAAKRAVPEPRPRRFGRFWRWKLFVLVLVVVIAAAAAAAPWTVTRFVLPALAARSHDVVAGSFDFASATFGWTSPLVVRDIVARDADGNTLLEIPELRTELSLFRILRSRTALGTLVIDRPRLRVVVHDGPTNLEAFLQPLFEGPPSDTPIDIAWQIREGTIDLVEPTASDPFGTFTIERLDGRLQRGDGVRVSVDLAADLRSGGRAGRIELKLNSSEDADRHRGGELGASLIDIPLEMLRPIWRRIEAPITLVGIGSGTIEGRFHPDQRGDIAWRDVRVTGIALNAPTWIGDDTVVCEEFLARGDAQWDRDQWRVELDAQSDYGKTVLRAESVGAGRAPIASAALGGNVAFDADLDLAKLARALPSKVRVRDQVTIESGRAMVHVASRAEATDTRWNASLETSDLIARHGDQPIVWRNPLKADLAATWNRGAWRIDRLDCRSEFLTARLEGSADSAQVHLDADLAKLAERLNAFIVMPADFRGRAEGQFAWNRHPPDVAVDASLRVTDFHCQLPGQPVWREPKMDVTVRAGLRHDANGVWNELRSVEGELVAAGDRLTASLVEPLSLTGPLSECALDTRWVGQLETWQQRLGPFLPLGGTAIAGVVDLRGRPRVSTSALRVDALQGEIRDLAVEGPSMRIREPRIAVTMDASIDLAAKAFDSRQLEIASSVVAIRAEDLHLDWAEPAADAADAPGKTAKRGSATGKIQFRSDLERLRSWFPRAATDADWAMRGEVVGRATLALPIEIETEIRDFQVASVRTVPDGSEGKDRIDRVVLWDDPKIHLLARGDWKPPGRADIEEFTLTATGARVAASGSITELNASPRLDLRGVVDYDWKTYGDRLRHWLGPSFRIEGKRSDAIELAGPLAPDPASTLPTALRGKAGVGWDAASYYGIEVGQGATHATLADAVVQAAALDIPVSGGMLRVEPRVDFTKTVPELTVRPGVLLDQVRISQDMCRNWLKFIAPLVANATSAEGMFTMQIDRLRVPLGRPEQADIAGALVVQEATIGPGPLAQAVIGLIDRLTAVAERRIPRLSALSGDVWMRMPSQVVAFEMRDGRVLHRELRMQIKEMTVVTRGWVALDQSMEWSIEIPVPDRWTEGRPLLAGLRGKTFTIPVRGTLGQPVLDERVFTELLNSILGAGTDNLLREQLLRGLDRLIRP
ncbi:MAG: hypothetical protein FJ297_17375 [Planctomycetes bacterium]|nr:hypothetical protein [Planctomycetota bacterium]